MPSSTPRRRADALLSRERIVVSAVSTLCADPQSSLERIAQVAGVHRATVYRHFPSRDALLDAVVARALTEGREVVARAAQLPSGDVAVYRLAADTARFGDRYSFLAGGPEVSAVGPDPVGLFALMQTWQSSGLLRQDVSPAWLAAAFVALAQALFASGVVTKDREPSVMLAEMFLRGAEAPDRHPSRCSLHQGM